MLVFNDEIKNMRTGLMLMTTIAPEYLCRVEDVSWIHRLTKSENENPTLDATLL